MISIIIQTSFNMCVCECKENNKDKKVR
ncbi:unnamed protein product, partial [Vitis vinifera]|uniref:Uncharacterized protein n=1 Tax=Vitis vinifera TaxID=29760 RepID=D7UAY6_VITVI